MPKTLKTTLLILLSVLLVLGIFGCAGNNANNLNSNNPSNTAVDDNKVLVYVPCGQQGPFFEIKLLFEKANPDIKLDPKVENISTLTQKISDGVEAPDVFMSMGDYEITKLEEKGLVLEGSRTAYAPNSLALLVSNDNPANVKTLKDITKPEVKLFTIVSPESGSAGYHGKEAMEKLGIWEAVKAKTLSPDEPELVAQAVGKGDAQAGIAYWPCLTETHVPGAPPTPRKKVKVAEVIPQELYTQFSCEAATIKGAKNPEKGKLFIEYLKSPQAQEIFTKWNFISSPTE